MTNNQAGDWPYPYQYPQQWTITYPQHQPLRCECHECTQARYKMQQVPATPEKE